MLAMKITTALLRRSSEAESDAGRSDLDEMLGSLEAELGDHAILENLAVMVDRHSIRHAFLDRPERTDRGGADDSNRQSWSASGF